MTDDKNAAAVRVLTGEVESLKRRLDLLYGRIEKAQGSADSANRAAARLSSVVGALGAMHQAERPARKDTGAEAASVQSWLTITDPDAARVLFAELVDWLGMVYVRYPDGDLCDCWAWHPAVVTELLGLRAMWLAAHEGEKASAAAVMDWHERHRPGVVQRVDKWLRMCGLGNHTADKPAAYQPAHVPGAAMVDDLAAWWACTHGTTVAPSPAPGILAEAQARARARDEELYGKRR
jgi:hypothetical protein